MFEHFTEHARRVLELEGIEAQRMHHDYLGTEHLLLGLIREPAGHGHRALESLGADLAHVREALAKLVDEGPETFIPDGFHLTERCRHVMELALEEARRLRHGHIGTEHLLLALLGEPDGVAMRVLAELNIAPEAVRDEVEAMLDKERLGLEDVETA